MKDEKRKIIEGYQTFQGCRPTSKVLWQESPQTGSLVLF